VEKFKLFNIIYVSGLIRPSHPKELTLGFAANNVKKDFILTLAKALLSFGAPSHRIEAQLTTAAVILDLEAGE
jgi:hypothetical protein